MKSTIILKSIYTNYKFKKIQERKRYSERKGIVRQKRLPRFTEMMPPSALDHTKKRVRL